MKQRTVVANINNWQQRNAGGAYYEMMVIATKLLYRQENENLINVCIGLLRKGIYTSHVT